MCALLGCGEDNYHAVRGLAAKWCTEPLVHGGQKAAAEHGYGTLIMGDGSEGRGSLYVTRVVRTHSGINAE